VRIPGPTTVPPRLRWAMVSALLPLQTGIAAVSAAAVAVAVAVARRHGAETIIMGLARCDSSSRSRDHLPQRSCSRILPRLVSCVT
jgi:hypothetical protein